MTTTGRLARRLGTFDAVVIGLGSMIGAGVFAAIGPAARAAGSGLLIALTLAAAVAFGNATSSAQLAALYPSAGGTYVYARRRIGPFWGYLAGWVFVVGKTASCAAIAITFGSYVAPSWPRPLGLLALLVAAVVDHFGVERTARATRVTVAVVLAALAIVIVAAAFGGTAHASHVGPVWSASPRGILEAAALLFFAFAGYARIATLGEEVVDPDRTIPRAIPLALGITLVVYGAVAVTALLAVGPGALANSAQPLATVVQAGSLSWLVPAVRVGAAAASFSVLLTLMAGVSRTVFAMASERDLPAWLGAVHPRFRVPGRAEAVVAAAAAVLVAIGDLRGAIGFSAFTVLLYYAITNISALTLRRDERRWPRAFAVGGFIGCLTLAANLPWRNVVSGGAVALAGALLWRVRRVVGSSRRPNR